MLFGPVWTRSPRKCFRATLDSYEQFGSGNPESMGEHGDDLDREIAGAILSGPDVCPMHAAEISKFLLRPLPLFP
jgi:hypothetical protein